MCLQDPRLIEDVLRFVLGESVEVGEDAVSLALEVFKKHSQVRCTRCEVPASSCAERAVAYQQEAKCVPTSGVGCSPSWEACVVLHTGNDAMVMVVCRRQRNVAINLVACV